MEITTIEKLNKGDYFKLVKPSGETTKKVYVYDGYCRYAKKYSYSDFNDICNYHHTKKGTKVTTDFIF